MLVALAALGAGLGALGAHGEPDPRLRVLVFSKTTDFRHESIPAGHAAIERLGERDNFAVDHTEDAARFTSANIARYDAVVFLSTTGDPLGSTAQKRAFRRYIERGGGFLGIHAASDASHEWRWYHGLVGARFRSHAPGTARATVLVEDRTSAATRSVPSVWRRTDEWYGFRSNPRRDVHVLASVDERTYEPGASTMGGDHPIAWCQRYRGGRSVYTAMGHTRGSYTEPLFRAHLLGSIRMAAGRAQFDCG